MIGLGVVLPLLCCCLILLRCRRRRRRRQQQQLHSATVLAGAAAGALTLTAINEERAQQFAAVSPRKRWLGATDRHREQKLAQLAASALRDEHAAASQSQEAAEGGAADGDDDLENIGERLSREQLTQSATVRARLARVRRRRAASAIRSSATPRGRRRSRRNSSSSTCRPASPGAEPRRAHAAVGGYDAAGAAVRLGAAFTSQFEQLRGPGGQVLNLPRIADEGPHWQSAGATSAPGAAAADGPRAAPRRLRPGDADAGRLGAGAGVSPEGRGAIQLRLRSPQRHGGGRR